MNSNDPLFLPCICSGVVGVFLFLALLKGTAIKDKPDVSAPNPIRSNISRPETSSSEDSIPPDYQQYMSPDEERLADKWDEIMNGRDEDNDDDNEPKRDWIDDLLGRR